MAESDKLTKAMWAELRRIAEPSGNSEIPHAGWSNIPSARALLERGLIERFDYSGRLGGGGAIGLMSVKWHCVKLTDAGRKILEKETANG